MFRVGMSATYAGGRSGARSGVSGISGINELLNVLGESLDGKVLLGERFIHGLQ